MTGEPQLEPGPSVSGRQIAFIADLTRRLGLREDEVRDVARRAHVTGRYNRSGASRIITLMLAMRDCYGQPDAGDGYRNA